MKVTRFDPTADLIIVPARAWGPLGESPRLNMVVDTGAAETVLIPDVLDELGYSARAATRRTVMRSAVGREEGYLIDVELGYQFSDFQIHVHYARVGASTGSSDLRSLGTSIASYGYAKGGFSSTEAVTEEASW